MPAHTIALTSLLNLWQVDGRIVIDTYAWNRFNPDRQISLSTLSQFRTSLPELPSDVDDEDVASDCTDYGDDDLDDEVMNGANQPGKARPQALTKDQLLLCSATLQGYSLTNKKWRK